VMSEEVSEEVSEEPKWVTLRAGVVGRQRNRNRETTVSNVCDELWH
jgi:hypothetical protein